MKRNLAIVILVILGCIVGFSMGWCHWPEAPSTRECSPCVTSYSSMEQPLMYREQLVELGALLVQLSSKQEVLTILYKQATHDLLVCRTAESLRVKNNK